MSNLRRLEIYDAVGLPPKPPPRNRLCGPAVIVAAAGVRLALGQTFDRAAFPQVGTIDQYRAAQAWRDRIILLESHFPRALCEAGGEIHDALVFRQTNDRVLGRRSVGRACP